MFSGTVTAKIDAKGRVFFPARFRQQPDAGDMQFVLRRDVHQPCLVLFPLKAWEAEVEQLRARLNRWDAQQAMIFRQYVGDTEQLQADASGRLLLSKRWLAAANLEREVAFIGVDDRIEIWPANAIGFLPSEQLGAAVQATLGSTFA